MSQVNYEEILFLQKKKKKKKKMELIDSFLFVNNSMYHNAIVQVLNISVRNVASRGSFRLTRLQLV